MTTDDRPETVFTPEEKPAIRFGWDICYTCNYRCPYCGVWNKASSVDLKLTADEWVAVWDRIYAQYGECYIFVSGAEPTTYPGFFDLIPRLVEKHKVEICTNLWWDISKVRHVSPKRLRISPTYHYPFTDFKSFLERAVAAKEYIADKQVLYVADPAEMSELAARSAELKSHGLKLIPLPIRDGSELTITEKDEELIREVSPYEGEKIEYQLKTFSPKGKLCRAGQHYAVVRSDGTVDRCSQYSDGRVGSIIRSDFKLFDEPCACEKEFCPIESQWIIG